MDCEANKQDYFADYEDLEVHKLMLEDRSRMEKYKEALLENKSFITNKVIMDVGCGTGILSIFCAQAGAKKVYAVEASNVANLAKEIIDENNYCDIIEVIHSKVEDIVLPDNVKVDIIISEWMGFYLLHEGMLNSVLEARDKFLKPDGVLFPETAAIYVAPCSIPTLYEKWNNFYGASLSSFAKRLRTEKSKKPQIMEIGPDDLLGQEQVLAWINLREDTIEDLNKFSTDYIVGASKSGKYQGVCIWFECHFPQKSNNDPVVLSTHPGSPPTHWKQAVIVLPEEHEVEEHEPIAFQIDMYREESQDRRYNLELTLLDPEEVEHPIPCSCYMTKCILIKTVTLQHTRNVLADKNGDARTILQEESIDDESE